MQQNRIADGQRTKVIYTLIKDGKYQDVTLIKFRLSISLPMNYNSVLVHEVCPYLLIATI
jgi:hypothetical protein